MQQLTAPQLAEWLADGSRSRPFLLDVREQREYEICHIENVTLMPMNTVPARIEELDPEVGDAPIVRKRIDGAKINVALSNSFGFGGTNAVLAFQHYGA